MPSNTILALNKDFILEFVSISVAQDTTEQKLFVHQPEANVKQVLGADTDFDRTGNSRLYSFYSNYNSTTENYLLDPTPFSFSEVDAPTHLPSEQTLTSKVPYKIVRLYIKAGYALPTTAAGIALKLFVNYSDKRVDLVNLFAPGNTTLFKPASRNLYIDETLYSSYLEMRVLDMSVLSNSTDTELSQLFNDLIQLGVNPFVSALLSDYNAEIAVIDNSEVISFSQSGANTGMVTYPFNKFISNSWYSNTQFLVDLLTGLTNYIARFGGFLEIGMDATGPLSIEQQLLLITDDLSNIDITHYVDIEEFDNLAQQIVLRRSRFSNDDLEWGVSQFIPIINVATVSLAVRVRTRIIAYDTGYDISKFTQLVLTGSDVDALRQKQTNFTLDVQDISIMNKTVKQQVTMTGTNSTNRKVTLTNSVVYVHWTNLTLTTASTNQTFASNDQPLINLFSNVTTYSFEFTKNNISQTLPTAKLYIVDGDGKKVYEHSRDANKVIFKLISGDFSTNKVELKSSASGTIAILSTITN